MYFLTVRFASFLLASFTGGVFIQLEFFKDYMDLFGIFNLKPIELDVIDTINVEVRGGGGGGGSIDWNVPKRLFKHKSH